MNEAQTLQAQVMASWKAQEVRLVSLTYVVDDPGLSAIQSIKRCQTLAASLDEAVKRARRKYGPGHLNSWGTRRLSIEGVLIGGGELLRGKRDIDHPDDLIRVRP